MTHGYFLYNSTAHVPLVLAGPVSRRAEDRRHGEPRRSDADALDPRDVTDSVPRQGVS
jgi:hypothetical protein